MKYNLTKFIIFSTCIYMLVLSGYASNAGFTLSSYLSSTITVYTREPVKDSIQCGNMYITHNAPDNINRNNILGESVVIEEEQLMGFLNITSTVIHSKEYVPSTNMTILYGYTAKIPTDVWLSNKRTNMQIALSGGQVTIGWPMILGSF